MAVVGVVSLGTIVAMAVPALAAARLVHICQHARPRPLQHIDNGHPDATTQMTQ
jgi:hypothetical protein